MSHAKAMFAQALTDLKELADDSQLNLGMHTNQRYTQHEMAWIIGYDQWARWLILVEWFWMVALAVVGVMPAEDARFLTTKNLRRLMQKVTTTLQDQREYGRDGRKGTNHDILALIELVISNNLPKRLRRWFHYSATSYDPISTAYALILHVLFERVLWPKLCSLDVVWREKIERYVETRQMGLTHLQPALPVVVGYYLGCLHHQYVDCARELRRSALAVPGKFCGAVGTAASQRALGIPAECEARLMEILGIPVAKGATQIAPAHPMVRFYNDLVVTAGPLASFADDLRIQHMPQVHEVIPSPDVTSSSSAMAAKEANPIRAEQVCGMDVMVITSALRLWLTRTTNFQRDLRWSSVMRTYTEAVEYFGQMLYSMERQLKALTFDEKQCEHWVDVFGYAAMGELLNFALQNAGYEHHHTVVNKVLVPMLKNSVFDLLQAGDMYAESKEDPAFTRAWNRIPMEIKHMLTLPHEYVGDAIVFAREEVKNALEQF